MAKKANDSHEEPTVEELLRASASNPAVHLPDFCSPENPVFLYVGRPVLETILEDNIAAIRARSDEVHPTEQDQQLVSEMIDERERLLAWTRVNPNLNIWVGLFPAPEHPEQGLRMLE